MVHMVDYSNADDVEQESEEVSWGAPRDIPYENSDTSIRVVS
ncbi:hypothetical protein SAMN04488098_102617 [Alkalibacterium thalassium]|jgi:hypothetical protein|uniref:Uncharacterized protein n=1 Tax=Alkalibacterium thalassium TaxID=426701 RepID=A0A1G9BC74_9LACT|nr:hypothetical protein SAMN04488098_102617 [Alkalibacterium thalassium]